METSAVVRLEQTELSAVGTAEAVPRRGQVDLVVSMPMRAELAYDIERVLHAHQTLVERMRTQRMLSAGHDVWRPSRSSGTRHGASRVLRSDADTAGTGDERAPTPKIDK
jgi:hypothetical protein